MAEVLSGTVLIQNLIWDEAEGFVAQDEYPLDKSRWHVNTVSITKRVSDGKLFMITWGKAATEYQEHEYYDAQAYECEEYIEPVTRYRKVA